MSIARQRSIRKIAAFRERYFVEHTDATWHEAGLAYVMQAGRQRVGDAARRPSPNQPDQVDYASFVETARAYAQVEATATRRFRVSSVGIPRWLKPALGS
jgi:hypothetical protein